MKVTSGPLALAELSCVRLPKLLMAGQSQSSDTKMKFVAASS